MVGIYTATAIMVNRMEIPLKKTLGLKLPNDPAISLLGICLEKTIVEKDTCTPMFIAALCTLARTWKRIKWPLTDELKRCHTYIQWNIAEP